MPGDPRVFLCKPPDPALDVVKLLAGPGAGEAVMQFLQAVFETCPETIDDAAFLFRPGFGKAPQPGLLVFRAVLFLAGDGFLVDGDLVA